MTETTTNQKPPYGVIYSAVTKKYVIEAIRSAKTVKRFHPDIPITLHSDQPAMTKNLVGEGKLFHQVVSIDMTGMKKGGFKLVPFAKLCKIRAMSTFPYQVTLYLDTDTKIVKSIKELWKWGSKKDICIANSPKLDKSKKPYRLAAYIRPKAYNSGVIVYNDTLRVRNLFKHWQKLCLKDKAMYTKYPNEKFWDQPKIVKLINDPKFKVDIQVLANVRYNARHTMLDKMKKDKIMNRVKIIHKH